EHELAAIEVGRNRAQPRGVDDARDAAHQAGDGEARDADAVDPDAGPACRLGIAADGIDVGAEARALEHGGPEPGKAEDDQQHPGHALDGESAAPVDVAKTHHDDAADDDRRNLEPEYALR